MFPRIPPVAHRDRVRSQHTDVCEARQNVDEETEVDRFSKKFSGIRKKYFVNILDFAKIW